MTEDDTFRKLIKPSFCEMNAMLLKWAHENNYKFMSDCSDFLNKYYWTVEEFIHTRNKCTFL